MVEKDGQQKELLFLQLVSMFQMAAMQQLGKLVNPLTDKTERDLNQAKFSIDVLNVLKEKTSGNLTADEDEFLSKVLFELQMNYVDEARRPQDSPPETDQAKPAEPSDEAASGEASEQVDETKSDAGDS